MSTSVGLSVSGRFATLTLDRPPLNILDLEMLGALDEALGMIEREGDLVAVFLRGAGERAFSAGADVTAFSGLDPVAAEALMRYGQEVYAALEDCPKPVLAAINGYALGGGLELALACDLRVATASAKLGQPEITLANLPGWGGTQRLPRVVGEARAKELIFTGRLVDAAEALAVGLVNTVVKGAALAAALELAGELCAHAPTALALAKQAIHAARLPGEAGYAVEREAVALCFATAEQQAAVREFTSRRSKKREGDSS